MVGPHAVLHGIGASAGATAVRAAIIRPAPGVDENEAPCIGPVAEGGCIRGALAVVSAGLKERARRAPKRSAPTLEVTAQLVADHGLVKAIDKELKKGLGVTQAVYTAVKEYMEMLCGLGGYMAERATNLYDVHDHAICELHGLPTPGVPTFEEPVVLVARDLASTGTATFDPGAVKGIITEIGGPTPHIAILTAQLGISAIVKVARVLEMSERGLLTLDGGVGEIMVSPTAEEVELLEERSRHRALALASSSDEGATYDDHRIKLLADIDTVDDAKRAAEVDPEGTGLFHMEFLFLDRAEAPSLEEQTDTYVRVLETFGERRVIVRTLNMGADRPLSFVSPSEEGDPALERRGLRLCQVCEDLIDTQLAVLATAHVKTKAELWVMAPVVATLEEAEWFAEKAHTASLPKIGIVIETPTAAIRASQMLSVVDLASTGTNDLMQYTMAVDCMDGELAPLLDARQPAVLQMIKFACEGGRATDKPVGMCGEAGRDSLLALVLAGLGVASLSTAPSEIRAARIGLRMHDLVTCRQMAAFTIGAPTPEERRNNVLKLIAPAMQALL